MSDEQQQLPGAAGVGKRRPRGDDTPEQLRGIRATLNVIGRDINDMRGDVDQASAQASAAATAAGHTREDVAKLAEAMGAHLDGYGTWRAEVEEAIAALTADDEKKPKGQPSWLTIDDVEQSRRLLDGLAEWIAQVWARYPDSSLPHCWAYHPWAVSELLGVWQSWKHAYTGKTSDPTRVEEWLDRWRPNTVYRLAKGLGGCTLADHRADGSFAYAPPRVPGGSDHLEDVAAWWASTHGQRQAPAPTVGAVQAERAETI
jgi:hypothetical protein